ncbi:hypothetical protein A8F94_05320 [Bacillus sp. FJAT-27225]|uniref:LiaI-LiaF-like domain-containing protein n=1 Tax=Bacillus sp. FJAT-27225 TaxID=1743144 RepID=UPI00080C2FC1|nr:DUF5668 domain-containing protein [Bacillus sp. FJAT-27225]OCA91281.1 hypothetical protein A8F94_05320 [Bacillus sp. FJAT-27225]
MRNQQLFPGVILVGFGLYFFLEQSGFTALKQYYTWPTLLVIVGVAFLCQGYMARDHDAILPGIILAGFGLHFHVAGKVAFWPNHIGTFVAIIALGFLLQYQKTGKGLLNGLLFLVVATLLLFTDKVGIWLNVVESSVSLIWKFWPVLMVVIGAWMLFFRKK